MNRSSLSIVFLIALAAPGSVIAVQSPAPEQGKMLDFRERNL